MHWHRRAFTWRSNSVLPGGFVATQGKKKCLDGANEDSSQEAIKDDIEQEDFCCQETDKQEQFVRTDQDTGFYYCHYIYFGN